MVRTSPDRTRPAQKTSHHLRRAPRIHSHDQASFQHSMTGVSRTTADDALVPFTHSKLFAEACRRVHVPVEFTLFPRGTHGMGLALDPPNEARGWTTQLLAWLARQWGA